MNNLKIAEYPELLSDEIIERASKLSSALLCDGMIGLDVPFDGAMQAEIMPVDMSMKVVGTACTVNTYSGDNLPIHLALYTAKPGYVMVIDGKGHKDHPYFGDLMMSTAKAVGLKGMIVDGCVRDKEGAIELGLPIFAKGFMQRGPAKKNPREINYPIVCGGIAVNPGDLIVGDADGVTVVPKDKIEKVLIKAEKKLAYEIERRASISLYEEKRLKGEELFNLAPQWVLDMLENK
jgi:4-hydroxy-4-methyl-2-oxoglutarate aldolase